MTLEDSGSGKDIMTYSPIGLSAWGVEQSRS